MSWLTRMYTGMHAGSKNDAEQTKNPNRVSGGLRAQGADRLSILGEDGFDHEVPSMKYVKSLEDNVRKQQAAINVLERKLARQEQEMNKMASMIPSQKSN